MGKPGNGVPFFNGKCKMYASMGKHEGGGSGSGDLGLWGPQGWQNESVKEASRRVCLARKSLSYSITK